MRRGDIGSPGARVSCKTRCNIDPCPVDRHRHKPHTCCHQCRARHAIAGLLDPGTISRRKQCVDAQPQPVLGAADDHHTAWIATDASVDGQEVCDLSAQMQAAARVAIGEVVDARLRDMTPGGRSQPCKKSRLHMGLAESEGRPAAKGQRDIRCRCNGRRCRQAGRDIGARAVTGLDQSVAREMLIGRNDHIAAYAKSGGKLAARRQTGAGRQQTVDDGGTQPTVDPKRLVADRAIKFDRREGRSLSWK